jgi:hypothetical protein
VGVLLDRREREDGGRGKVGRVVLVGKEALVDRGIRVVGIGERFDRHVICEGDDLVVDVDCFLKRP